MSLEIFPWFLLGFFQGFQILDLPTSRVFFSEVFLHRFREGFDVRSYINSAISFSVPSCFFRSRNSSGFETGISLGFPLGVSPEILPKISPRDSFRRYSFEDLIPSRVLSVFFRFRDSPGFEPGILPEIAFGVSSEFFWVPTGIPSGAPHGISSGILPGIFNCELSWASDYCFLFWGFRLGLLEIFSRITGFLDWRGPGFLLSLFKG